MATTNKKAETLSRETASKLKVRLTEALSEGFGTDGDPIINIGSGVDSEVNCLIRTKGILGTPAAVNVVDLATPSYGPTVIQIVTEANPSGGAGADILGNQFLLDVLGEVLYRGTVVEWYLSAAGSAPVEADITGTPAAKFNQSVYTGIHISQ